MCGQSGVSFRVIQNNIDVGGTGAFQQSTTSVHGSRGGSETNYLIDGMNIGSCLVTEGSRSTYDPFMFEQLAYQTGGVSAETSRGGFVYNMVTQTGTNRLRGSFMFKGSNDSLQFNNISPELRKELLLGVHPLRWLQTRTSNRVEDYQDVRRRVDGDRPCHHRQVMVRGHDEADVPRSVPYRQLQPRRDAVCRRQQDGDLFGQAVVCTSTSSQLHYILPVFEQAAVPSERQQPDDFWESASTTCRSSKAM